MHTIALSKANGSWVAKHSDPKVRELFGTDTIPTAFTDRADALTVLRSVSVLNPDRAVTLAK